MREKISNIKVTHDLQHIKIRVPRQNDLFGLEEKWRNVKSIYDHGSNNTGESRMASPSIN